MLAEAEQALADARAQARDAALAALDEPVPGRDDRGAAGRPRARSRLAGQVSGR